MPKPPTCKINSLEWLLKRIACAGYELRISYEKDRPGGDWAVMAIGGDAGLGQLGETLYKAVKALYKRLGLK